MSIELSWPLAALFGLGLFHGLNPGMGWLFAVALGLQERRRSSVWKALPPLAAGHALAVAVALGAAALVGTVLPAGLLKWAVAGVLLALGAYRLVRSRHPRYGGMHVNGRQLMAWSFLMATAHGAGLMTLPFVLGAAEESAAVATHAHAGHPAHAVPASTLPPAGHDAGSHTLHRAALAGLPARPAIGLAATASHTAGYLLVMGLLAVVVYEWLGLRLLRTHWFNLDLVWSAALVATAVLTVLL